MPIRQNPIDLGLIWVILHWTNASRIPTKNDHGVQQEEYSLHDY